LRINEDEIVMDQGLEVVTHPHVVPDTLDAYKWSSVVEVSSRCNWAANSRWFSVCVPPFLDL